MFSKVIDLSFFKMSAVFLLRTFKRHQANIFLNQFYVINYSLFNYLAIIYSLSDHSMEILL